MDRLLRKTPLCGMVLALACAAYPHAVQAQPPQGQPVGGPRREWQPQTVRTSPRMARRWMDPAERAEMQRARFRTMQAEVQEMPEPDNEPGMLQPNNAAPGAAVPPAAGKQRMMQAQPGAAPVVENFGPTPEPMGYGGDGYGCGCGNPGCGGDCGYGGDCGCGDGCCGDGCCGDCGECGSPHKFCICLDFCWFQDLEVRAGVQGFKGPVDLGLNGNFGFHDALNWGAPLPILGCLGFGFQAGVQGVHSNFASAGFTPAINQQIPAALAGRERNQLFFTGGIFRRTLCGLQGGMVVDYLRDSYWVRQELAQLRGEVSYIGPRQNEIGFWFTHGLESSTANGTIAVAGGPAFAFTETWWGTDIYAGFLRKTWCNAAQCRVWGGATGPGDGIVGADIHIPLGRQFALDTAATWLIPREAGRAGQREESWNVGITLTWYPGRGLCCPRQDACWGEQRQFRPLFNVADNGTFMVDRTGAAINGLMP